MSKYKVGDLVIEVALDAIDVSVIRAKTPVRTGNLRDGFDIDLDGNITNLVDYADEVEYGTVNRPGAFMVERSLPEIEERLVERIAEQIDRPGIIKLPDLVIKVGR